MIHIICVHPLKQECGFLIKCKWRMNSSLNITTQFKAWSSLQKTKLLCFTVNIAYQKTHNLFSMSNFLQEKNNFKNHFLDYRFTIYYFYLNLHVGRRSWMDAFSQNPEALELNFQFWKLLLFSLGLQFWFLVRNSLDLSLGTVTSLAPSLHFLFRYFHTLIRLFLSLLFSWLNGPSFQLFLTRDSPVT